MDPLKRRLVSVTEAARLLCLTAATIRNLIADHRLDGQMIGKTWVVTLDSVDAEFARRYPEYVRRVEE